jgi:hypothetical protein
MGLTGLIKTVFFCSGSLIDARWRRGCAIYRAVLQWAVLNRVGHDVVV